MLVVFADKIPDRIRGKMKLWFIEPIPRKISAWLGYNSPTRGQASLIKGLRAASGES